MTDDEINAIVLDFLELRGGYVAGASERELFWMLKYAIAAECERCAQKADLFARTLPSAADRLVAQNIAAAIRPR